VIVGGTLIIFYDMQWIDPAITIGIAVYILYLAFAEIGGPIRTLMLGSPPDIDGGDLVTALRQTDGVKDVHHVHLWQMEENAPALDAHIVVEDAAWGRLEQIKAELKAQIGVEFGINHSTLEMERNDACDAEAPLFGHAKRKDQ
jgi:cobalt-zinc-cadmium efflux system protein